MNRLRLLRILAATVAAAIALTACGGAPPAERFSPQVGAAVPAVTVAGGMPGAAEATEAVVPAPALRLLLDQLLGEHAALVTITMRRVATDAPDQQDAIDALQINTDALTGAIGLVYGSTGAQAFESLWAQHIAFFLEYGAGRASGNGDTAMAAMDHLDHYERDFGSFVDTATAGDVPGNAVTTLLDAHTGDLQRQVDDFLGGDVMSADELAHIAYTHMATVAKALAGGIAGQFPVAFPGSVDDSDAASALTTALGEHVLLIAEAGRAIARDPDTGSIATDAVAAHRSAADPLVDVASLAEFDRIVVDAGDRDRDEVLTTSDALAAELGIDEQVLREVALATLDAMKTARNGDAAGSFAASSAAYAAVFTLTP